jgi:FkbM family methyltransferase
VIVDEFEFLGQAVGQDAKVVFDVGAKYGRYTGQFLRLFPEATVYAVDCAPSATLRLMEAYGQHERVEVVSQAFLDAPGEVEFNLCQMTGSSSVYPITATFGQETRNTGTVTVPATTLYAFCLERGIEHIDLLKIDCEGSDLAVLNGAAGMLEHDRIKAVHVELLFFPYYCDQCWYFEVAEYLIDWGFELKAMWPMYWGGRLRYAQAFFE